MSEILFWLPDSFMGAAIALIAIGVIIGVIKTRRAWSLIALIAFLLLSGPFIDSLVAFVWKIVPLWLLIIAAPIVLLALARGVLRMLLGERAFDHMVGTLAADGMLWFLRKGARALAFPLRSLCRKL